MIKAIIFDLDGTICDTLTDLGECTNQALADFNLPPHKIEEYRKRSEERRVGKEC